MSHLRAWYRYSLQPSLRGRAERALLAIVNRLPRRVVYWATIRLWAHATSGPWSSTIATELRVDEALKRWEQRT